MGTNFYFYEGDREYQHIGKRSAAGLYCWDCGVSLCDGAFDDYNKCAVYGNDAVHHDCLDWLDECPICGAKWVEEKLSESTSGRELGFNKTKPGKKEGVTLCSSFSWAISPAYFVDLKNASDTIITDEYGITYTKEEFADILRDCPIQCWDLVDKEFS